MHKILFISLLIGIIFSLTVFDFNFESFTKFSPENSVSLSEGVKNEVFGGDSEDCKYTPKDEHPSKIVDGLIVPELTKNNAMTAITASEKECYVEYDKMKISQNAEADGNKNSCVQLKKSDGLNCRYDDETKKSDCRLDSCTRIIVNSDGTAKTEEYPVKSGGYTLISSSGTVATNIGTGPNSGQGTSKTLTSAQLADLVTRVGTKLKLPLTPGKTYWYCTDSASYDKTTYTCT